MQERCPLGWYCSGDGRKQLCPAGSYGDTMELKDASCSGPCADGYMCPSGSTSATQQAVVVPTTPYTPSPARRRLSGLPSSYLALFNVASHDLVSGQTVSPTPVLVSVPPSPTDIVCEVLSDGDDATVSSGEVTFRSTAEMPFLSVAATPASVVWLRLRCRRETQIVTVLFNVTMRPCVLGEVQPPGLQTCVPCPVSSFSWVPGERVSAECHQCPHGARCEGGAVVTAVDGFWRQSPSSLLFHPCRTAASCLGLAPERALSTTNTTGLDTSDPDALASAEGCEEGLAGPLCSVCADGWGRLAGKCHRCSGNSLALLLGIAGLLVLFLLAA